MRNEKIVHIQATRVPHDNSLYCPSKIDIEDLHLRDRGLAWRLTTCSQDAPVWDELRKQVAIYNSLIELLLNTPGFWERFSQNGHFISVEEIINHYGQALADRIAELKHYKFATDLVYLNGYLFDTALAPEYKLALPGEEMLVFALGKTDAGYPVTAGRNKRLIWNWSDDERDFTFGLWSLFDELGYLSADENCEKNYDGYLCYDQHRYVMNEPDPSLLRCFRLLEAMGYLIQYIITPEAPSPWFNYRASKDGTIGLAVLDHSFTKDKLLLEKICLILGCTEEEIKVKRYFLTNSNGHQELSEVPGAFGGHQRYKIYGRMDCSSANRHIANGKYIRRRVFFADEETAIAAGYRPCAICMRKEYKKWKDQ